MHTTKDKTAIIGKNPKEAHFNFFIKFLVYAVFRFCSSKNWQNFENYAKKGRKHLEIERMCTKKANNIIPKKNMPKKVSDLKYCKNNIP